MLAIGKYSSSPVAGIAGDIQVAVDEYGRIILSTSGGSGGGNYETVAASQTDQILGATGAVGDYLAQVTIVPATTSPGNVLMQDGNGTEITLFLGGASSVATLHSWTLGIGARCINATTPGWKITTGANVSVICTGTFT